MEQLIKTLALLLLAPPVCAQFAFGGCDDQERRLYEESVRDAVVANWTVPYDDRYIACTVLLTLNWRGEVLNVGIANCGDDSRVHRSIVDAGYSASPLRMPKNRACFERNVIVKIEYRPLDFERRRESVDTE